MNVKVNILLLIITSQGKFDKRSLPTKKMQFLLEKMHLPIFEFDQHDFIEEKLSANIKSLLKIDDIYLDQLYTWTNSDRINLDGILLTYLVIANEKAIKSLPDNYSFYDLDELTFDCLTSSIIKKAQSKLQNNPLLAFSFIDKEFTITELQQVYELLLNDKLVSSNFRKKIKPLIKRTDKLLKDTAYRPSYLYKKK